MCKLSVFVPLKTSTLKPFWYFVIFFYKTSYIEEILNDTVFIISAIVLGRSLVAFLTIYTQKLIPANFVNFPSEYSI